MAVAFKTYWMVFQAERLLRSSGVHWADLVHIVFQGVHILLKIFFYLTSDISPVIYSLFSSHFHSYCQDQVYCWAGCAVSPSPGIHCKARTPLQDAFHLNTVLTLWHWLCMLAVLSLTALETAHRVCPPQSQDQEPKSKTALKLRALSCKRGLLPGEIKQVLSVLLLCLQGWGLHNAVVMKPTAHAQMGCTNAY